MGKATVFANDMSIAAKYCDGKSSLQLVDVCHSPGKGRPKPYKNTAYAKQLANASTSVFISQLPVAQKDKSYFANSTGNEKATRKYGMGINTHVIKGGAYFVNWSPDVFIEGYNAPRHNDMMTHNHVNQSNTSVWVFKDSIKRGHVCRKDFDEIEKKCSIKKDRKKYNKKGKRKRKDDPKSWKEAHCDGLLTKPRTDSDITKLQNDIKAELEDLEALLGNGAEAAREVLGEAFKEALYDFGKTQAAKAAAKAAIGAWIPVGGWLWAAGNLALAAHNLAGFAKEIEELSKDFETLIEDYKKLTNGKGRELWEKLKNGDISKEEMADLMSIYAQMNPCIRARRCNLRPYSKTTKNLRNDDGCCPGQTPHHVIPDSWMSTFDACPEYTHGKGLAVCAEGTGHSLGGSHALLHTKLDAEMKKKGLLRINKKPSKPNTSKTSEKPQFERLILSKTVNLSQSIDMAAGSVVASFPSSACDRECLVSQLQEYYKNLCSSTSGDMELKDHKGNSKYDIPNSGRTKDA